MTNTLNTPALNTPSRSTPALKTRAPNRTASRDWTRWSTSARLPPPADAVALCPRLALGLSRKP